MSTENKMNFGTREPQVIKTIVAPISNNLKAKITTAINAVVNAIKDKHL
jgi:hypothetical protein